MIKKLAKAILHGLCKLVGTVIVPFGPLRGKRIRYHPDLNLDNMLGLHEPNTFALFDILIKKGMNVADIGSNIGYFSIFLNDRVGPTGVVHAFEAMPHTFARMCDNVKLNNCTHVKLIQKAVSDSTGKAIMHVAKSHYMSSLNNNWANSLEKLEVDSITLDDYCQNSDIKFDALKVDIEGGAIWALKGMRKTIIEQQPILILESHTPQEDIAIGMALSWAPYKVFRVGSEIPVLHLDRDHTDVNGIYGTVLGIPEGRLRTLTQFSPLDFQKKRWGQRL